LSQPADPCEKLAAWFAERIPPAWSEAPPRVLADEEEILVLLAPAGLPEGELEEPALALALSRFREATRDQRVAIARVAEAAFGRKVSWGVVAGGRAVAFTSQSVPVMTRLRLPERQVLDTLIDAGVARSRSEALAWCVRLVADNEAEWIGELRRAFESVEAVRRRGPASRRRAPRR
jgi:hypothetical protein